MTPYQITRHGSGQVLWEGRAVSFKAAVEQARGDRVDLRGADLKGADLGRADLAGLDLREADLSGAYLRGADLAGAHLGRARLRGADLRGACLRGADLRAADLRGTEFRGADLMGADLREAVIEFRSFPAFTLPHFPLGDLPDDLCLELMLRDAHASPEPDLFALWAEGGRCPLETPKGHLERKWLFHQRPELLQAYLQQVAPDGHIGPEVWRPKMNEAELILALCRAKGWGIRGLLAPAGGAGFSEKKREGK
ncbi:MAG: pentapeptide repeat-containing protein [Thermodesulfobacteriota bacterium]